jgi:hypothetical protein
MSRKLTGSPQVIPPAVYTALDRLGEPGTHLLLFGSQNYLLSEKVRLAVPLTDKTLQLLQTLEWLGGAERTEQGLLECRLTLTGWQVVNQRRTARDGATKLTQLAFPQLVPDSAMTRKEA